MIGRLLRERFPVPGARRCGRSRAAACAAATAVLLLSVSLAARPPAAGLSPIESPAVPETIAQLQQLFERPPDDAAPMMRWWWFGPAVTHEQLEREMRAMKAGGIGGVEIQPVYPLALDDEASGIRSLPFLSDEFIEALRFVSRKAQELQLRVDLTLGSGWPFGGPGVPIAFASAKLRVEHRNVDPGARAVPTPAIAAGEHLIAVFLEQPAAASAGSPLRLPTPSDGVVRMPADLRGPHRLLFFISSRTGMQVKRAAVGAEGFVLDHYSRDALDGYLKVVGDRLMTGFPGHPPYAVFCDSLEAYEGDWTGDLLDEFRRRRGYDLTAHLPALVSGESPESADVRHDWGRTITELVNERFLGPLHEWATRAGTRLRAQAYGIPPASLSSNALVDISEGEGAQWTRLTASRWASSATHIFGRQVATSETWTWLHSPSFRASPLDMKAEADRHFLQGINQLVGHGWPYSPPGEDAPGWRFYAAGAFNDRNPWWIVMPDVTRYLQRVSFLLRQGKPAADVAVYLPTSDAWAHFTPGHVNLFETLRDHIGPDLLSTITAAGFAFDLFDDDALATAGRVEGDRLLLGTLPYRAVILPGLQRVPTATLRVLEEFARAGGVVVATRRLPDRAPGLRATDEEHAAVRDMVGRIFQPSASHVRFMTDERAALLEALPAAVHPDVRFTPPAPAVGFVHRRLPFADVYFVANTSNVPVQTRAAFRVNRRGAEAWNPMTGEASPVLVEARETGQLVVRLTLEPYGSRVVVFSDRALQPAPRTRAVAIASPVPLEDGWLIRFPDDTQARTISPLRSWTDDEDRQYFSGVATYERDVRVPAALVKSGLGVRLDLGEARAIPPEDLENGMRAWLDAPVREAAVVWVNGTRVGSVWSPPYAIDVTGALRAGENRMRIDVANLAINGIAGRPLPSYRLLNARYGTRFEPQDMDKVRPQPSGLLGTIRLVPFAR
jgi:hypothetical protein